MIVQSVRADPEAGVREVMVNVAAWSLPIHQLTPLLWHLAAADRSPRVRGSALSALSVLTADGPAISQLAFDAAMDAGRDDQRDALLELAIGAVRDKPEGREALLARVIALPVDRPRRMAIETIGRHAADLPDVQAFLHDLLHTDPDPLTRAAALRGLIRDSELDEPHIRALLQHEIASQHPAQRAAAVSGFGRDAGASPDLECIVIDRAKHDPHPDVRAAAAALLSGDDWPETPETDAVIRQLGANDPSAQVRAAVIAPLLRRTDPDGAQRSFGLELARRETSAKVRAAAVDGMTHHGETHIGCDGAICRTWAIEDPDGEVRHAAIEALRTVYWREHANINVLGERAHADPDPQVRTAALNALLEDWAREPGARELVEALAITDPDPSSRRSALDQLRSTWS